MRGFSLTLAFLYFRSDGNDRSFRACCAWNETNTATVLRTLQPLSILTGFLYGDFMTKDFISHHTFPEPSTPGGMFVYNRKEKKSRKPATYCYFPM
jgi:hypothetical protein